MNRRPQDILTGSQTITDLSKELEANFRPSDEKQQLLTGPW